MKTVLQPNVLSPRQAWEQVKDLPRLEEILEACNIRFLDLTHRHNDIFFDVCDWVWIDFSYAFPLNITGKTRISKRIAYIRPHQAIDLILGEITRRMGGCPCDNRLKAWTVFCAEAKKEENK